MRHPLLGVALLILLGNQTCAGEADGGVSATRAHEIWMEALKESQRVRDGAQHQAAPAPLVESPQPAKVVEPMAPNAAPDPVLEASKAAWAKHNDQYERTQAALRQPAGPPPAVVQVEHGQAQGDVQAPARVAPMPTSEMVGLIAAPIILIAAGLLIYWLWTLCTKPDQVPVRRPPMPAPPGPSVAPSAEPAGPCMPPPPEQWPAKAREWPPMFARERHWTDHPAATVLTILVWLSWISVFIAAIIGFNVGGGTGFVVFLGSLLGAIVTHCMVVVSRAVFEIADHLRDQRKHGQP